MWCIAHKGEVNWADPEEGDGCTSLHAACEADRRRAAAVLLLNGANMCVRSRACVLVFVLGFVAGPSS